ncbi:ABC transporter substrate-binding protein, partial [Bacteroidales bacterium OttesenSCG-928-M11]|nr:ABC transporter substrate-binding protein [Bacteroidales bacterium OttesenSCG-928-M11]
NPISGQEINSLQKLDFPIFHCIDYKETTPLGQTEWIRLIGLLYEKEELADSLFRETENRYLSLAKLTEEFTERPCVFSELKYGDFWHVPGGKSYLANLFRDAGADYRWKDDTHSGSIALSFEQVLDQAEDCNYWLVKYFNPGGDLTLKQLSDDYKNYSLFSAFRNHTIYGCNTAKVSYYEELPLHPDRLLKDLIYIFHPELLPEHTLRYYQPLP